MTQSTNRRPPTPRISVVGPRASDDEAAAIMAALELFLADTAPALAARPPRGGWQRAALEEGIGARSVQAGGWGQPLEPS